MKKTQNLLAAAALMFGMNAFAVDESANRTFPTPQSSEGNYVAHVGVLGGLADVNGPAKPSLAVGVDAGFQPFIPFGLGIQAIFYKGQVDAGVNEFGIKRSDILLKGTYNFGGDNTFVRHSYIGLKTGVAITKNYFALNGGSDVDSGSYTRFAVAPVLGFDYPVADHLTLGAELSYLIVTGPEANNDVASALASVKYWF